MRTALTIAGSDSSGGAGIQADLKTFAAFGVYGTCAITAITAQNTLGMQAMAPLSADLVTAQMEAVAGDIAIHATKIGMLATSAIVEAVAAAIRGTRSAAGRPRSGAGVDERRASARRGRRAALCAELIPLARVVTPNMPEAEVLSGMRIESMDDAREAARRIHDMGAAAVIITGGHANVDRPTAVESPSDNGERRTRLSICCSTATRFTSSARARIDSRQHARHRLHVRGGGRGGPGAWPDAADAAERAQQYVAGAIAHAPAIGHGRGPLDHFWGGILKG